MSVIQTILKDIELFENLDAATLLSLSKICRKRRIDKKAVLFNEGDPGYALYYCIKGNIQLSKFDKSGKETVIKIIKEGEMFGEVVLFEQDRYPVSARSLSQSDLLLIPKSEFYGLLEDSEFRNQFISVLIKKQRYLVEKIKSITAADIENRIYRFLKDQYGDEELIMPQISKKDVAAAIGTAPETLSRVLLRLKTENKLEWDFDHIRINPKWRGQ
jgi:CRP/FNR family transcriptional regulator